MGTLETNIDQVNSDFLGIKSALLSSGVSVPAGTPTSEYAGKVTDVYDKGKQDQYDEFWDVFQVNGDRRRYSYAFSNGNFSVATFYPKYDIILEGSNDMLFNSFIGERVYNDEPPWSLKQRLAECGIVFDTSKATTLTRLFDYCYHIAELPTIDLSSITTVAINRLCGEMYRLVTLEKLVVKDTIAPTNAFYRCDKLKNIVIEGTIGQNGFNFQWSKELSKDSITSIVNALSTTTSGKTITFSQAAVNKAFESSPGANDGSTANNGEGSAEWQALKATKSNWVYTLA